MRWTLKHGDNLEWFEQLEAEGKDIGGVLDDRPELTTYLVPFWNAFHVLSNSRQIGMGIGGIPLSAFESYFRIYRITDQEDQLEYIYMVGALDSEYLAFQNEKSKKQSKEVNSNAKSRPSTKSKPSLPSHSKK